MDPPYDSWTPYDFWNVLDPVGAYCRNEGAGRSIVLRKKKERGLCIRRFSKAVPLSIGSDGSQSWIGDHCEGERGRERKG